jgi:hypothetical protein
MLYEYSAIENFLSATGKTALKDSTVYATFAAATETVIVEKCGAMTEAPAWLIMPYVWILEYLASGKMAGGSSPDFFTRLTTNYNNALKILVSHPKKPCSALSSNIGEMEGLYTDEY